MVRDPRSYPTANVGRTVYVFYAPKISSINGGDRCALGTLHSSLKPHRSQHGPQRSLSAAPKKIFFQIENNLFYEPQKDRGKWVGRNCRAAAASAARRAYASQVRPISVSSHCYDSLFRLPCLLPHAPSLNSLFKLDSILIGRRLSKDSTARLASWDDNGSCSIPKFKVNGHRTRSVEEPFSSADGAVTKPPRVCDRRSRVSKKQEPIPIAKTTSKPLFDLSVNLRSHRAPVSRILNRPSSVPPSHGSQHSVLESRHRSSLDVLLNPLITLVQPSHSFEDVVINIPVLGFRKCGKTSLLNSLVQTQPVSYSSDSRQHPTYYYPMVDYNDQVFHFRLIDCPMLVQDFPLSTLDAWSDFRGWGLHLADLFILVFDITSDTSFQYMKLLREQIIQAKMGVPMVIVANKIDLLKRTRPERARVSETSSSGPRSSRLNVRVFSRPASDSSSATYQSQDPLGGGSYRKMAFRRDLALMVKKHWKQCTLVECSALYNFNTLLILKEVMRFVQFRQVAQKPTTAQAVQAAWQRNQCCVL